jgi:hypothetical protein
MGMTSDRRFRRVVELLGDVARTLDRADREGGLTLDLMLTADQHLRRVEAEVRDWRAAYADAMRSGAVVEDAITRAALDAELDGRTR